jgi:mannose/fructose/N-acetylgalactosamine-specific phosphotransferase system component IIC
MSKIKDELAEVERGMVAMGYAVVIAFCAIALFFLGWWMLYHWKLVLLIFGVLGAWSAVLIWRWDGK